MIFSINSAASPSLSVTFRKTAVGNATQTVVRLSTTKCVRQLSLTSIRVGKAAFNTDRKGFQLKVAAGERRARHGRVTGNSVAAHKPIYTRTFSNIYII